MSRARIISAIDIGTEKICTVIASVDAEQGMKIMGVASFPSRGIKKSQITALEETIQSLTESVDAAERMAGLSIKSAYVSISGVHIDSQNSKGVVAVSNPAGEISSEDIERVLEAARALSLPSGREILHVIPTQYSVDSQSGIKDPRGMAGIRLECEAHVITVSSTSIRNITRCVTELGIQPTKIVFSGLASAEAVLSETEKELGVVAMDIGSGSITITVFVEGSPMFSKVLPVGARHITSDIALGLRISLESAEKIKLSLNSLMVPSPVPEHETRDQARERKRKEDELHLETLGIVEHVGTASKRYLLEGIVEPRLSEIFKLLGKELESARLLNAAPAGVVITGGGSETMNIAEVCKKVLMIPARVARPEIMQGLSEELHHPAFSTAVGLLRMADKEGMQTHTESTRSSGGLSVVTDIIGQIKTLVKQFTS